jgi:hypothetical protein
VEYGDFDDDFPRPDNAVFDLYEINYGNKKLYIQNLLKNYPHTSPIREKSYFPLYKDFYNLPKQITDKFHGRVQEWIKWRGDDQVHRKENFNDIQLMIKYFIRKVLEGIVWKDEIEQQDCDFHLILPTYHELRNRLREN